MNEVKQETNPYYGYYDSNSAKILVLAFHIPNKDDLMMKAKKIGVGKDRIDFVEYTTNFDYAKLRCSSRYSDILIGPVPHNGVGIDGATSFIAQAEHNQEDYPKLTRLVDSNGTLKISLTSFEQGIRKTNLYRDCVEK